MEGVDEVEPEDVPEPELEPLPEDGRLTQKLCPDTVNLLGQGLEPSNGVQLEDPKVNSHD